MPGANDLATFNVALAERASHVQAHVVDGADCAVHIRHANQFSVEVKFFGFSRAGEFRFRGQLHVAHAVPELKSRIFEISVSISQEIAPYATAELLRYFQSGVSWHFVQAPDCDTLELLQASVAALLDPQVVSEWGHFFGSSFQINSVQCEKLDLR